MFTIDYKSHLPIYEQLVESVKVQVLTGVLQADDPLPSVRQLSGQLGINPNTVQKAYALLEQQGIIYAVPGKGNFISPDTDTLRQQQAQTLQKEFINLAQQLRELGLTLDEVQSMTAQAFREEESR